MVLGKRKRDIAVVRRPNLTKEAQSMTEKSDTSNDVFRKYFEAAFDPLPEIKKTTPSLEENGSEVDHSGSEENDNEDFSGFSEDDIDDNVVEVIDTTINATVDDGNSIDKIFKKSFMVTISSKPPRDINVYNNASTKADSDFDPTGKVDNEEAIDLKLDLDLQRLLRESHLLSSQPRTDLSTTNLSGRHRHQAQDIRLQDLGSKKSVYIQEKMPMTHRKGIQSKTRSTEERRRKEAKENGIILEKAKGKPKTSSQTARRDRGVDVPVLGKFRGGTLSLSKSDIASIQGSSKRGGKKRGKR